MIEAPIDTQAQMKKKNNTNNKLSGEKWLENKE